VTLFSREGRRYLETGPFFKIHFVRPISQRFRRQNAPPCGPPGKQPKTETNLITPSVVSVTFISTSRSFPFPLKNRVHCIIRLLLLVSPMLNTSNSNISRKCAEFFFSGTRGNVGHVFSVFSFSIQQNVEMLIRFLNYW
jgi:hypothetical protein